MSYYVHNFAYMFTGRPDAYGSDHGSAVWNKVTVDLYERHLNGTEPIGIYPVVHLMGGSQVKWGCCDIDTGDWEEAYMLYLALSGMKLNPWIERSRSKGWHIWVFSTEWVTAAEMRRCLKVAYAAIDLPAREANPKSENLQPNQLGNYVRLPYKGALVAPSVRQTMMYGFNKNGDGEPLPFTEFMDVEHDRIWSDPRTIRHWASKWYERPRRQISMSSRPDQSAEQLVERLPSSWKQVWTHGDVRDRSATFVAMAYDLAKRGWQAQDVYDLLWACPWNKYRERNDGEHYVQDIVERAFS